MAENFHRKSYIPVLCSLVLLVVFPISLAPKASSAEKKIVWNLSAWGGKMASTAAMHDYAAHMEKKTNGRWEIRIHYGSVLAPPKEQLDGIRGGVFELAFVAAAYAPGKNPLLTVAELPFITPIEDLHTGKMVAKLLRHPAIKQELLKWNAVPFLPMHLPQYRIMGKKPLRVVADLNGLRIRAGGEYGKLFKKFGAVPTMIPGPEAYEAIDRGTIDAVSFPWTFAFGTNKIYEVSKFAINIPHGTLNMIVVANKDAWDALPGEFKKYHREWYNKTPERWSAEYQKADDKWLPIFRKHVEFIDFPTSERNKIVAKAGVVYERWVERMKKKGLPGRDVLDYYLKERKNLTGY